jgi:serine/threonine protein kinase
MIEAYREADDLRDRADAMKDVLETETSATVSAPSREPDLKTVSSPPRRSLTYEDIEIGDSIGSGGQGVVSYAELTDDNPPGRIALKEPQEQNRTLTKEVIEAFLREAETWKMLDDRERQKPRWKTSEHIVGIVATGDQLPWIAMEYMDGGSLGDRLADNPNGLPIEEGLWIGECICRGVELAHNYGIAHLDLKPANILFRETPDEMWDVPKLADWGVSRKLAEQTGTMDALSVEYAAPEQFEPQKFGDPDMLTDIYQVGVLLYTIFTGNPPHTGTRLAVKRAVVAGERVDDPSERRPDLPDALDDIIPKALATEKSARYRTIGVLANDLQSLRSESPVAENKQYVGHSDRRGRREGSDQTGQMSSDEELHCPNCGEIWKMDESPRPGDICPNCHKGYVSERQ